MKKLLFVGLLLAGCAAQKSPEEIRAEEERRASYNRLVAAVKVSKNEPADCESVRAVSVRALGPGMGIGLASYEDGLSELKKAAVEYGANFAVIDNAHAGKVGSTNYFFVDGRLYRCP